MDLTLLSIKVTDFLEIGKNRHTIDVYMMHPELMVQTQSNGGKVISNVTATRSGNVVTVDIEVSQMSEATLHLTDLSGRVHNATTITLTPEMAPINIDAGTSPVGEYIVVLTISGEQPLRILARQR